MAQCRDHGHRQTNKQTNLQTDAPSLNSYLDLQKVGGGVTAHSHVRFKFRCLDNRSALKLKSHQKQTYLFRARSFIAKHGVLLVMYVYLGDGNTGDAPYAYLKYVEINLQSLT